VRACVPGRARALGESWRSLRGSKERRRPEGFDEAWMWWSSTSRGQKMHVVRGTPPLNTRGRRRGWRRDGPAKWWSDELEGAAGEGVRGGAGRTGDGAVESGSGETMLQEARAGRGATGRDAEARSTMLLDNAARGGWRGRCAVARTGESARGGELPGEVGGSLEKHRRARCRGCDMNTCGRAGAPRASGPGGL
jgi:hypothetical protein